MTVNFSVRLDDDTEHKLDALVDHYNRSSGPAGTIKPSQVVRFAVERLYAAELGEKPRK